jgi:butyryl-CoA dehydrogenase
MKRAVAGQLPLLPAIKRIMDEVMEGPTAGEDLEGPLASERKLLTTAKKLSLFAAGAASQKHMQDLPDQQEIMGALADCIIEVYALESCLLRTEKLISSKSESSAKNAIAMTRFYAARAIQIVEASAKKVIAAVAEGDMLRTQLAILRRLAKYEPVNTIALSRQIAKNVVAAGRYTL